MKSTSNITPQERREKAKQLLESLKAMKPEYLQEPPEKTMAVVDGVYQLVYNAAAARKLSEAIITASDELLEKTAHLDIETLFERFVFCQ